MSATFAITSGEISARIDPLGAELVSLTDSTGREYIWQGDPAWWSGRAPLLFPIVGALNGGRYRVGGGEYAMEKHGFARRSVFETVDTGPEAATFRLRDSDATRAVYPFAFSLELDFRVEGRALHITAAVANPGPASLPFSFGYHPAFAWPLPGGAAKDAHRVTFKHAEPAPIRRIDPPSGLVLPDSAPTAVVGDALAPEAALFEADALIWDRLESRACRFGAAGGASLDLAFPDTPMLGVWQKPGAPFLCIEPWQGIADPVGFTGDFRDKPGVVELAPGAARKFRLSIAINPPENRP